jgi:hypothetical protein
MNDLDSQVMPLTEHEFGKLAFEFVKKFKICTALKLAN